MSTSIKPLLLFTLGFYFLASSAWAQKNQTYAEMETARVGKMAKDPDLTVERWVAYFRETDERCKQAAKKGEKNAEAICNYFYSIYQAGLLFVEQPVNRTIEICDDYLGIQDQTKDDSIQAHLEKIVGTLCLKK